MSMVTTSVAVFISWTLGMFLFGACIGGLIVYKIEEHEFEVVAIEEEKLRLEQEAFNDRIMLESIDNVPEYLRGKYDIQKKTRFTESDEDLPEIYV